MEQNQMAQPPQPAPAPLTPPMQAPAPPAQANKTYRKTRILLVILGLAETHFPISALYSLFQLIQLQWNSGDHRLTTYTGIGFFTIALLLAILQIYAGATNLVNKMGEKATWGIIIAGLIFAFLSIPAILMFVIIPGYSITSEF